MHVFREEDVEKKRPTVQARKNRRQADLIRPSFSFEKPCTVVLYKLSASPKACCWYTDHPTAVLLSSTAIFPFVLKHLNLVRDNELANTFVEEMIALLIQWDCILYLN
jgi:hypothetical protein